MRQSFWVVLIACFFSCSHDDPTWSYDQVIAGSCEYDSGKLWLRPENTFRGLELELTRSLSGVRMYVNVFSLPFTKESQDSTTLQLKVSTEEESYLVDAYCLEGGQKLLLLPEGAEMIINSLFRSETVAIAVGRYESEISSNGFAEAYQRLYTFKLTDAQQS